MKNRKALIAILLVILVLAGVFAVIRTTGKSKDPSGAEPSQEASVQENTKKETGIKDEEVKPTSAPEALTTTEAPTETPIATSSPTPEPPETLDVQEEVEIIVPEGMDSEGF